MHLLQKVILTKKVRAVPVISEMTIGSWEWAHKKPNSVKSKKHSPYLALLYGTPLSIRLFLRHPKSLRVVLHRFRSLYNQARRLNSVT